MEPQVQRLEDRLALLKGLVDGIEDAVALLDATGTILYANSKMAFGPGHGPDDVRGKSLNALSLIPPPSMPPALSLLGSVLSGQAVQPFRVDACGSSGETTPMEIHMTAIKRGERVIGAVVTARSTAGAEIRVPEPRPLDAPREERFRSLIENGIDWIWETNEKGVYTYCGAGVRGILGYEPREVLGKSILDLAPLADANRLSRTLGTAMSAREPIKMMQVNNLRKDGQTVTLETTAVPVIDAAGRFSGYQGVHRDVTGRGQQADRQQTDRRSADELSKLEKTVNGIIQALTLIVEARDPYIVGHQQRVSELAGAIVKEMPGLRGRMPDLDKTVRMAGLLHDLGMVFVPAEILTRRGPLTPEELASVRNHARAGYDVLKGIEFPWPIAEIVLQHHERVNGSGYPSGLKGEDIRVEARIIAVADSVEAMVHARPHRAAKSLDDALREINRGKAALYDPEVAEACLNSFLDRGFRFPS